MTDNDITMLKLPASKKYLGFALDYFENVLKSSGLDDKDILKMRLATEESSLNVIEHAFDPDEDGKFNIIYTRRPYQVVIKVHDKGLPTDFQAALNEKGEGLGIRLMKGVTDEVRFLNLGRDGKQVELIKNLPYKNISETLSEDEKQKIDKMDKSRIEFPKIKLRFMRSDEASTMARCVYRSYGYSYSLDFIYFPDKIKENLESGIVKSVVCVDEDNEIVGHLALNFEHQGAKVGETGQAVVDPRYRGHSLFKKMKQFMVDYAIESGMFGIYSEAVTAHPFTQKGNLALGARETGFLICYVPATVDFKKIQNEDSVPLRQSAVLFYLKTNEEPERVCYPPARHKEMITKIYDRSELNRILKTAKPQQITEDVSKFHIKLSEDAKRAFIRIIKYGKDIEHAISFHFKDFCTKKIELIFIDLPLSDPITAEIYEMLEDMGFFFTGIIPEFENGDVVRFEYLNNVVVKPEIISRVSDFVKELFDYIMKERDRVST